MFRRIPYLLPTDPMTQTPDLLCRRDEVPVPDRMHRTPDRPLGTLSDFVVEELPSAANGLLTSARVNDLCIDAEQRLAALPCFRIITPESLANIPPLTSVERTAEKKMLRLALLDLSMLERRLLRAHEPVPERLLSLTKRCATGMHSKAGLMYEGIIHANPLQTDPRVFSDTERGQAELFFYEVHARIEKRLAASVQTIRSCIASMAPDTSRAVMAAHNAIDGVEHGFRSLHQGLDPDEFARFRDCFSNAHRRLPGPSALFSAGMYSLDALLAGNATGVRQLNAFKERLYELFPTTTAVQDGFCGRDDMNQSHFLTKFHDALLFQQSYPVNERLNVAERMVHARAMHLGIAKRFLPEGFNAEGTGGAGSLRAFLQIGIDAYGAIVKILPLLSSVASPELHAH